MSKIAARELFKLLFPWASSSQARSGAHRFPSFDCSRRINCIPWQLCCLILPLRTESSSWKLLEKLLEWGESCRLINEDHLFKKQNQNQQLNPNEISDWNEQSCSLGRRESIDMLPLCYSQFITSWYLNNILIKQVLKNTGKNMKGFGECY